jgi:hypothetical protein
MITVAIVHSKDGVPFDVTFDARSDTQAQAAWFAELQFAGGRTAAQLDSFAPEYRRHVEQPADELPLVRAPAPQDATPAEHGCDPSHEALCRAQARWRSASVVQGDRS